MTVARRLGIGRCERRWLVAHARVQPSLTRTEDVLVATERHLFDAKQQRGIVWLTPPGEGRHQLMFVAIADTTSEAAALAGEVVLAMT